LRLSFAVEGVIAAVIVVFVIVVVVVVVVVAVVVVVVVVMDCEPTSLYHPLSQNTPNPHLPSSLNTCFLQAIAVIEHRVARAIFPSFAHLPVCPTACVGAELVIQVPLESYSRLCSPLRIQQGTVSRQGHTALDMGEITAAACL